MRRRRKMLWAVAALVALSGTSAGAAVTPACAPGGPWTQSQNAALDHGMPVGGTAGWSNMTLRQEVTLSGGGTQLRIHLSNEFASSAVVFGHVSVGQQLNSAQTTAAPVAVTFGGAIALTLQPGQEAASDAVALPTVPGERLLASVYLAAGQSVTSANAHTYTGQTEYNLVGYDGTMQQSPQVNNTYGFASYLDGVDVDSGSANTVVAVGDSITDQGGAPSDADAQWTAYLARRTGLDVVNNGISGNQVEADIPGGSLSLQHRWQHDVLNIPGVRTVIDEDGINDLRAGVSASSLEQAQTGLAQSAHAAGLRFVLTTITPCTGASSCTTAEEQQRQLYNTWVRSGASGADAVADFDAAVAGGGAALSAQYDSGDHIHPNAAGMDSLANVVDISKL